jgi:hypothetical protein
MARWRYSIPQGDRLIDSNPTKHGDVPIVWNPTTKQWGTGGLTVGEYIDAVPITDEEAEAFMKDGTISDSARRRLDLGPYDPD